MQSVLEVLHIHNYAIGATALVLNVTLLWSLTTCKAVGWQSVRLLLVLNAAIDALLSAVVILAHVAVIIHSGVTLASCTGPLSYLGPFVSEIGICIFYDLVFISYLVVPATLVYRYAIIDHHANRSPKVWFRVVLVAIFIIALPIICAFPSQRVTPEERAALLEVIRNRTEGIFDDYPLIGTKAFTFSFVAVQVSIVFELIIAYTVIIVFSLKTHFYIRKQARHMSDRTREMQRQITLALLLQAAAPILTGVVPSCVIQIVAMSRSEVHPGFALAAAALHAWLPLSNALIALAFYKPYRDHIFQRVKNFHGKNSPR